MSFARLLRRRTVLAGLGLLASPVLARAQNPVRPSPSVESVSMVMPGDITYRGRLFKPLNKGAPSVVLVPDGWGLTPGFEAMGAALASEGILGLVVDMLGGKTARDSQEAEKLARGVNADDASEAVSAWYDWLRNRVEGSQRVAAFGFGPGGRWAIEGSLRKAAHGVTIWSTRLDTPPADLASLYEPSLIGHYSDHDTPSGAVIVAELEARLRAANRTGYFFRYGARPFFYNPRSPDYDKLDAALAWRRTINIYRRIWDLPSSG
jgi:carboxymethylenebutenolidase